MKKASSSTKSKTAKAPYKIDTKHADLAEAIVTLQAKDNSTLIRVGPHDADPAQNIYFNQESLDSIYAAKDRFVEAKIVGKDQVDFGKFNGGFVIPKEVLNQLHEVPDLQGLLICLGAFTKAGPATILDENTDMGLNTVIFPIFRVITSEGMTEHFLCPHVPEYFPPNTMGDIYYCPPLNVCPKTS